MNIYIGGFSIGTIIAAILSWQRNKSVFWALIHGFLGWFYIIFVALTEDK
jgi:predicted acylesterase/phospholipase RssA